MVCTTSETGTPEGSSMPSLPTTGGYLPAPFVAEPTFPRRAGGGLGAAQESRIIPARFCLEQPRRALRERGQGEVRAVAALVTGQDAGPGWTPNKEEGGRGGALGGRTLRVMRREEFGARI